MRIKLLSAAIMGAALIASPSVAATTITGSAAVSIVGVAADMASIDVGTTFTNTLFSIVGSATGDLVAATGQNLNLSPLTAAVGQVFTFTSNFGDFAGTVTTANAQGAPSNRTVNAYVLGTFTPTGALAGFLAGPASATFAFTQTGSGLATSGSFTFASPPAGVPEPSSWAMLIAGFGLVGAAARRRRQVVA